MSLSQLYLYKQYLLCDKLYYVYTSNKYKYRRLIKVVALSHAQFKFSNLSCSLIGLLFIFKFPNINFRTKFPRNHNISSHKFPRNHNIPSHKFPRTSTFPIPSSSRIHLSDQPYIQLGTGNDFRPRLHYRLPLPSRVE